MDGIVRNKTLEFLVDNAKLVPKRSRHVTAKKLSRGYKL